MLRGHWLRGAGREARGQRLGRAAAANAGGLWCRGLWLCGARSGGPAIAMRESQSTSMASCCCISAGTCRYAQSASGRVCKCLHGIQPRIIIQQTCTIVHLQLLHGPLLITELGHRPPRTTAVAAALLALSRAWTDAGLTKPGRVFSLVAAQRAWCRHPVCNPLFIYYHTMNRPVKIYRVSIVYPVQHQKNLSSKHWHAGAGRGRAGARGADPVACHIIPHFVTWWSLEFCMYVFVARRPLELSIV